MLLILSIAAVGLFSTAFSERKPATIVVLLLGLWGIAFLATVIWRLLTGRARRDGGLVSPLVLRVWGVLSLTFPMFALVTGSWRELSELDFAHFLWGLLTLGSVGWFFRLASVRSGRAAALRGPGKRSSRQLDAEKLEAEKESTTFTGDPGPDRRIR